MILNNACSQGKTAAKIHLEFSCPRSLLKWRKNFLISQMKLSSGGGGWGREDDTEEVRQTGEEIREMGVQRGEEAREKRKMLSFVIYSFVRMFQRQEPKMLFDELY